MREIVWAYLAGLVDGEAYLDIMLRRNPAIRKVGRGYSREYRFFLCNGSKTLLEKIKNQLDMGAICLHKWTRKNMKCQLGYTLRFSHNEQRIILPHIIPHLKLKSQPARLMLLSLNVTGCKGEGHLSGTDREIRLLQIDKLFREACCELEGSRSHKKRKDDEFREQRLAQLLGEK